MPDDWAQTAADAVLNDLRSRRGIGDALDGVDEDIAEEIRETVAQIIRDVAASNQPK